MLAKFSGTSSSSSTLISNVCSKKATTSNMPRESMMPISSRGELSSIRSFFAAGKFCSIKMRMLKTVCCLLILRPEEKQILPRLYLANVYATLKSHYLRDEGRRKDGTRLRRISQSYFQTTFNDSHKSANAGQGSANLKSASRTLGLNITGNCNRLLSSSFRDSLE